jgi:hypothetical protein
MSFARSSCVSTVFGVNCASAATKLILASGEEFHVAA